MPYRDRKTGKWQAVVRVRGKRTTRSCPNKKAALELEANSARREWMIRNNVVSESDLEIAKRSRFDAEAVLEAYVEELAARGCTRAYRDGVRTTIQRVNDAVPVSTVGSYHPESAAAAVRRLSRNRSVRTHNAYVQTLRSFGDWLKRMRYLGDNPFEYLQTVPQRSQVNVTRSLTVAEVERLLSLKDNRRVPFYRFVLFTGFRWGAAHSGGEAARLRIEWYDRRAGELVIPEGVQKNGMPERVPLSAPAMRVLDEVRRLRGSVFDSVPGRRTWERDLESARVALVAPDGKAHRKCTRKTFATRCSEAGELEGTVGQLLRHRPRTLAGARYIRKTDAIVSAERDALARMVAYHQSQAKKLKAREKRA